MMAGPITRRGAFPPQQRSSREERQEGLIRIANDCWQCKVLLIDPTTGHLQELPGLIHTDEYQIAQLAAKAIEQSSWGETTTPQGSSGFTTLRNTIYKQLHTISLEIKGVNLLKGKWYVDTTLPKKGWGNMLMQYFPFFRTYADKNVVQIYIKKGNDEGVLRRFLRTAKKTALKATEEFSYKKTDVEWPKQPKYSKNSLSLERRIKKVPFSDAWTEIATDAFQRWENHWVPGKNINCKYQIVLRGNKLLLESNRGAPSTPTEEVANSETVAAYRKYILQEYGKETIDYIEHRYGFNLQELEESGYPLQPEHIWRINIGVNNIEQQDTDSLYSLLQEMAERVKKKHPSTPLLAFFESENVPLRILRGIKRQIEKNTRKPFKNLNVNDLNIFLESITHQGSLQSTEELPLEIFSNLLDILWTPKTAFNNLYTGRKIEHLPIMGFYTMARKKSFKPQLDQQEALQVFGDLERSDWNSYYELLSHVICKKHFIRRHPKDLWRVGALIPAPRDSRGRRRWYRIDSCTDNNKGDFHYTLVPACQGTSLPAIKLYRSTASDNYHPMGSRASIDADLRSYTAPGCGNRSIGDEYEIPFFEKRTIPVWVGYIIKYQELIKTAKKRHDWERMLLDFEKAIFSLLTRLEEDYKHALETNRLPPDKTPLASIPFLLEKFQEEKKTLQRYQRERETGRKKLSQYSLQEIQSRCQKRFERLEFYARILKERPEDKIPTDISFVGHSLGGALAQGSLYHFGAKKDRIPLPGHKFTCYTSDAPAITNKKNRKFMLFGRTHADLLETLESRIQIFHNMEYGDFIPQYGGSHLGTTRQPKESYKKWLSSSVRIFKPLKEAKSIEVLHAQTHGRRFGLAKEHRDYTVKKISIQQLAQFDHAWQLGPLRKFFGYKIFNSPKISEIIRRIIGLIRAPLSLIIHIAKNRFSPEEGQEIRDRQKVLFCSYKDGRSNPSRTSYP